jgi:predicted  nucleic acid-binding Zn-ribbon protein
MDLNADMAADIPEAISRARVVIKSIARMGHTPEAVLVDIDEARTALTGLRHEVEKAKDAEVAEKAIAKEKQAEAARTRIQELETEIQQLSSQAAALDNEALAARSAIDRDQLATIRYIDNISRSLDATAREVRSINPQPARAA